MCDVHSFSWDLHGVFIAQHNPNVKYYFFLFAVWVRKSCKQHQTAVASWFLLPLQRAGRRAIVKMHFCLTAWNKDFFHYLSFFHKFNNNINVLKKRAFRWRRQNRRKIILMIFCHTMHLYEKSSYCVTVTQAAFLITAMEKMTTWAVDFFFPSLTWRCWTSVFVLPYTNTADDVYPPLPLASLLA